MLWPTRTHTSSNNPTSPPDGATAATTPAETPDCFADTLRAEQADQYHEGRTSDSAKIRIPGDKPVGSLPGRTAREVWRYARGRLYGYSAEHGKEDLKRELGRLGHGSWALIIAEHETPFDNGIGAHTYRMRNKNGRVVTHGEGQNQNTKVFYAILYTRNNTPIEPHWPARTNETIPPFPRKTRIGAPTRPRLTNRGLTNWDLLAATLDYKDQFGETPNTKSEHDFQGRRVLIGSWFRSIRKG
ncbi:MAG: hypothetical protein J2P17_24980, partial [Mycobacterium sp.]|nr:hypothetical protein [Mycobacterium sp.]